MLRRLFRLAPRTPAQVSAEMREEIESHIMLGVDELVARGVPRSEAEATVRSRYRDLTTHLPELIASAQRRSSRTSRREVLHDAWRDVVFGVRQLRRAPVLAFGVTLCLAFGIGASATVFSWMEGLVLRPLPAVGDIDRLISVRPDPRDGFGISIDEFQEWKDQSRTTSGLTAVSLSLFNLQTNAASSPNGAPVYGMFVSANYFHVLDVGTARGRTFLDGEDRPGSALVAVISDALWRQRLGSDPDVIGRHITLNGRETRVIGVAPADFGGSVAGARFDVWVPLNARPELLPVDAERWRRRDFRWLDVIGRLRPGVTLTQANAEFEGIGRTQALTFVENRERRIHATDFDFGTVRQLKPLFSALVVVTGLLILLICANVANLLLARATARRQELAVRLSLGASRPRLIRQLLTESGLLAAIGAALGIIMAYAGHGLLAYLMPKSSVSIGAQSGFDLRFALFVIGVTSASVIAFGLVPALGGSRFDLASALRAGARGLTSTGRIRTTLVVTQFALALSALVCAALFLRRDRDVRAMDVGFRDPEHVLLVQVDAASSGIRSLSSWRSEVDRALGDLARLPGVRGTAVSSFVPLGFLGYTRRPVEIAGKSTISRVPDRVLVNAVTPGYFDLMRIPIVSGRPIDETDSPDRPATAVVNEAFVLKYFAATPPLGRTITLDGRSLTIVGVVKNGKYDYRVIDDPPPPFAYFAWHQAPTTFVNFHLRTDGDPIALANAARAAIAGANARATILAPVSLAEYSSVPFFPSRSALIIISVLGVAALVLASMGLFSVISYGVELRRREIGIRVALGATRIRVVALFVRASLNLVLYGVVAGTVAAFLFVTLLRSQLQRLPAGTAAEFILPALLLACSAIAAGFIPAGRAARIDPARTLRTE